MKRFLVFALLAMSMLAGCGGSPVAIQSKQDRGVAAASQGLFKVQIVSAKQLVHQPNTMRLVVLYKVMPESATGYLRQLIIDTEVSRDRVVYRSGFRPVQMVLNGVDVIQDERTLLQVRRELDPLAYHTVSKEEQQFVALAAEILDDLIH